MYGSRTRSGAVVKDPARACGELNNSKGSIGDSVGTVLLCLGVFFRDDVVLDCNLVAESDLVCIRET